MNLFTRVAVSSWSVSSLGSAVRNQSWLPASEMSERDGHSCSELSSAAWEGRVSSETHSPDAELLINGVTTVCMWPMANLWG